MPTLCKFIVKLLACAVMFCLTFAFLVLITTPSSLRAEVLSDEELLRRAAEGTLSAPTRSYRQARPRENGSVIGPIRDPKTGIRGAIINNDGDSARGLWRINRNRTAYEKAQIKAWPNADEVGGTFRRDHYWFSENNFWGTEDHPSKKASYDAWTHDTANAVRRSLVVSCMITPNNERRIKFFMTSHNPINMLGRPTRVWFDIGDGIDRELPGARVSNVYVGNVHVDLTPEEAEPFLDRMKRANWVTVYIQTVQGLIVHQTTYSLKGFTAASANTIAACYF